VAASLTRLLVAALGGWIALRLGAGLAGVFAAQAAALVIYGVLSSAVIAGGAWFGPLGWPRRTDALLRRFGAPSPLPLPADRHPSRSTP
jgi:hypothetical protein